MKSNFFLLEGRHYLNNAIVIADILSVIAETFGDVTDFKIKFRKPYNSQADLEFSTVPLNGHTVGSFQVNSTLFYFSYVPNGLPLHNRKIDDSVIDYFNLSYAITDAGRSIVQESFEKEFGPMTATDKVIFAVCDIVDTSIINSLVKNNHTPKISISHAEHIGSRRFKYSVHLDDKLFSHRYCSVKEFNI